MKKILATLLAIILILGTLPVMGLVSSADDPVALGAIIASAGYAFEYSRPDESARIACDFYFGDGDTVHDGMVDILTNDPEIVPGTMVANLSSYTFSVSLTADGTTQTHAPSKVESKDDWGTYDQGVYFYLADFTLENGTSYTVRIDITTPGGNAYYYEESGLVCSCMPDASLSVEPTLIDGTNVTWAFDALTGTLTFAGTGAVPGYDSASARPWNGLAGLVERVIAESGITSLGKLACNSFSALDYIYLADSVESTGFDCFAHSGTITSLRFSPFLTSMAQGTFYSCTIVDVYYEDEDGDTYTSRDFPVCCEAGAYNDAVTNAHWVYDPDWGAEGWMDENETVYWAFDADTGTLTITGTGEIPAVASKPWQQYVSQMTTVVIGDGLTLIPSSMFAHSDALDKVYLADTVTTLKGDAFAYCGTIEYVKLSVNATKFSQGVFYSSKVTFVDCALTREEFQANLTTWGAYNDNLLNAKWSSDPAWGAGFNWTYENGTLTVTGTGVMPGFADCENGVRPWDEYKDEITTVVIAEGVTSVAEQAFNYFPNLETVEMADTVTTLNKDAFAHDGSITTFQLSPNVTTIAQGVVYDTEIVSVSCVKAWAGIQAQATIGLYNDAFANATWTDVLYNGILTFGKYGSGMENWGTPIRTQMLITPKWNGEWTSELCNKMMNVEWTFVISDGTTDFTTHLYPDTKYDGGSWGILRFVFGQAQIAAERFVPTRGVRYTVTATVTIDGVTDACVSTETFTYEEEADPITYNYYTITWTIDGVEEYTEEVIEGFKPVYRGAAASYVDGNNAHVANIPETAAATENTTYNITYTVVDVRTGKLDLWSPGYENWPGSATGSTQTELLLRPKDWQGNDLSVDIYNNSDDYTWIVTINGVAYNVKPTSHYSNMIVRFEPCLWATRFVPQAGESYTVDLEIYDANDALVWKSTTPATITVAADFEPIVPSPSGDIDGDGELAVGDVSALLDLIAASSTDLSLDLDGDGEVAVSDVSALLDMIATATVE